MIGRLRGVVLERTASRIVLDVHGVGYVVQVLPSVSVTMGEEVDLHIHTAVREDAITLFGFSNSEEKSVFDLLLGVQGVGPVKAMGILQTPVSTVVEMVARRQPAQLAKLPGVGKKTAERILLDLGDKLAGFGASGSEAPSSVVAVPPSSEHADLVSALVNLGFKEAAAVETARLSVEAVGKAAPLEALLRDALARNLKG